MATAVRFSKGNLLLRALSAADRAALEPHLSPAVMRLRQSLERPNRRIDDVYFPDSGIVSIVALHREVTDVRRRRLDDLAVDASDGDHRGR